MHVLCPSCTTEYEIPVLLRPRKLRCAGCATEWRVLPPAPDPAAFDTAIPGARAASGAGGVERPAAEPAPAPVEARWPSSSSAAQDPANALLPKAATRTQNLVVAGLWVLSLALIAGTLFALWRWQGPVGHFWPASQRVYRLLRSPSMPG